MIAYGWRVKKGDAGVNFSKLEKAMRLSEEKHG
jgi:hypothetical protein